MIRGVILALALASAPIVAQTPAAAANPNVVVERDVPAKMRDGVTLRADIYRPNQPGTFPALVMRTPYDKSGSANQSGRTAITNAAVERGYVVVIQDSRGTFKSEGFFTPYAQERNDGYDTIEWVAALPYVNGKVGTFGLSYPGAVQWMAAPTAPPHLVAIAPSMTFASHHHFINNGGIFGAGIMNWVLGRQFDERKKRGLPITSQQELTQQWEQNSAQWTTYMPRASLPLMEQFPYWKEWATNGIEADYWKPFNIEAQHHLVKVPALNFSGWNDDAYGPPGATRNFVGMRKNGSTADAKRGQRLIIGPWVHGVPSRTRTSFGGLEVGPNAIVDYTEIQLRFFDYWMKGIDNGYSSEPPVRIFVMGDNVWRNENEWPIVRTQYTELFLRAGGQISRTRVDADAGARFTYDPKQPATIPPSDTGPARNSTVLTYTTDAFTAPTEVTGNILLKLWVASTAVDTDITARLYEVNAAGELRRLTVAPGVLRARYRSTEDPLAPKPLTPNQPTELTLSLGYTSYVIPAGHKLRLFVTGSLNPNVHLNVYAPFVSMDQAITATQTVQHSSRYPSRIILPVIPR